MNITCIQIGRTIAQGTLVRRNGKRATISIDGRHMTGRVIESYRPREGHASVLRLVASLDAAADARRAMR